jgi:YfiH family protein
LSLRSKTPDATTADALAALPGIRHGFFGRRGGVSRGIYASLNCGPGSRDDPEAVAANRARVAGELGVEAAGLVSAFQMHGPDVCVVDAPWGRHDRPRLDGMVTRRPGVALGVLAADCGPVLFADADAGVIGAAHAGWRGALTGVLEATVAAMEGLGARRSRIAAALGPCIHQPSYEVGPDFPAPFLDEDPASARFFAPGDRDGHRQFDLPGYIVARLEALGLAAVESLGVDTYAQEERLFSYRRATHRGEDGYGRNISAIVIEG